jgi:hypothetical protein
MKIARRTWLKGGAVAAVGALPLPFVFQRKRSSPSSSLQPDPARLIDLPAGFQYRVLQQQFEPMKDGYRVPALPDGMACFPGGPDSLVLMRNHEISIPAMLGAYDRGQSAPPEAYDPNVFGGVTRLVLDSRTLAVRSSNLVLTGTSRNCAGGASPWGWLTCEETTDDEHGYVFLCRTDADRVQRPQRITGYGRFKHEAVAIDPSTHVAYLTEDQKDGCLYRFVPRDPHDPFRGKLQALRLRGTEEYDTSELPLRRRVSVDWVDVPEPNPSDDSVRDQAHDRGAALFRRGEGICLHGGAVYACATIGGPQEAGQIFKLTLGQAGKPDELEVLAHSTDAATLDMPDNVTVAPWGDVVIAEDGTSTRKHIRGIGRDGRVYEIARNARSTSEVAGVCFSPDGQTLFFNIQRDGLTVAVTGPFASLARQARA